MAGEGVAQAGVAAGPLLLLPLGVWARCSSMGGKEGDLRCEVGVLRGAGAGAGRQQQVATCTYVAGKGLVAMAIGVEVRQG